MSALILKFPTTAHKLAIQALNAPVRWRRADREALLLASRTLAVEHTITFEVDHDGDDYAILTPDNPEDAYGGFVVGWTQAGDIIVTNATTGSERTGRTIDEVADMMRLILSQEP